MVSSSRQAIACILLIFGATLYSQAQTTPAKSPTASISGKVTMKGKGVPGIKVIALPINYRGRWDRARHRATTDSSGNYQISNLPEGNYQIRPHAIAFVVENERANLMIAEGETVEDINFALVQGGVITGKVTDSEGHPLIEQYVHLTHLDSHPEIMRLAPGAIQTDDRGIYRVFGLRAGRYKVAAGAGPYRLYGISRQPYKHTFYPSTTDEAKATVIEVTEGSEIRNVDIVMAGRAANGFKVAGRIIDGDSGKPLSNIVYGLTQKFEGGSRSSMSGQASNVDGEFKFENVLPGNYSVYIEPARSSGIRANPVPFEVTDRDITGLTIKTTKAASLSGIVVLDGADEKQLTVKPGELFVQVWIETSKSDDGHDGSSEALRPDGIFKISGLRGGIAHISVTSMNSFPSEFAIVRVEREGVAQPNDIINLKDGEQVDGIRIIVQRFTGAIRGQVKIEDGELPPSSFMSISATLLDDNAAPSSPRSEQADSRGHFHLDALKAGRYEVQVSIFVSGPQPKHFQAKKEVTVVDNTVSEVVLTVKLNP